MQGSTIYEHFTYRGWPSTHLLSKFCFSNHEAERIGHQGGLRNLEDHPSAVGFGA